MKKLSLILIVLVLFSCKTSERTLTKLEYDAGLYTFIKTIKANQLKKMLYTYSSDEFEGRDAGKEGERKATNFLKEKYMKLGIPSAFGNDNYFQTIPAGTFDKVKGAAQNVLAYIEGSEKPEELVVISAHLDHVGKHDGEIYNGADDDGSGTVALLEVAEAFKIAMNKGYKPKRSILFLHVTAEEKGLLGSKYYTENPVFPLENTIANLNVDMIGRQGYERENDDNYVYLIGSDKLSTDLHNISEQVNDTYVGLRLDYRFRKNDPNRYYYRSDHYNFAKHNIPIIFYFNGIHDDYHKPTDTAEKINYDLLEKRSKLIFATAWELANRAEKPVVDKAGEGN